MTRPDKLFYVFSIFVVSLSLVSTVIFLISLFTHWDNLNVIVIIYGCIVSPLSILFSIRLALDIRDYKNEIIRARLKQYIVNDNTYSENTEIIYFMEYVNNKAEPENVINFEEAKRLYNKLRGYTE
jgi:hypothetical protein